MIESHTISGWQRNYHAQKLRTTEISNPADNDTQMYTFRLAAFGRLAGMFDGGDPEQSRHGGC